MSPDDASGIRVLCAILMIGFGILLVTDSGYRKRSALFFLIGLAFVSFWLTYWVVS